MRLCVLNLQNLMVGLCKHFEKFDTWSNLTGNGSEPIGMSLWPETAFTLLRGP